MEFGSIKVGELSALIDDIRADFDRWIHEPNDSKKPLAWTGLSGDLQKFFKASNIQPFLKYKQHYSSERHTIAASYVWQETTLLDMTAEFAKPEYREGLVFIDVLLVPQQNLASEQVVGTTSNIYVDCWVVAFVKGGYLRRAWCCCELAVATKHHCRITVVGTCDQVVGRNFFDEMDATVKEDIVLIKKQIEYEHGTAQKFNDIVARAMEVLFVAAAKSKLCELFNVPRHERIGWSARMQANNPQEQQRDHCKDWEVLVGNMTSAWSSSNRTVTICLISTLTDTMLEWSFFHQDCVQYLEKCALQRGLDLVVSDMRCGCKDEDSVTLEIALAEMRRCKAESAAVCFLVISGDKYGHRPIPTHIPKPHFNNLVSMMSAGDAERVKGHYCLDENLLDLDKSPAPEYLLQTENNASNKIERDTFLAGTFRAAAKKQWPLEELRNPKSKHPVNSFFKSQVETELFHCIVCECEAVEAQDVHVYLRLFQPETLCFHSSPVIGIYADTTEEPEDVQLLRYLQDSMITKVLKPECITRYEIPFEEGIDLDVDLHKTYLCNFLDHACNSVLQSLDRLEQRLAEKPYPMVDEVRCHLNFAHIRDSRFCNTPSSRTALIKLRNYVRGDGGRTFILWAPSGAGKTYILAKAAAEDTRNDAQQGTVVIRFLGTSQKSSDALSLLQSVCEQLQTISMGKESFTEGKPDQSVGLGPCPTSYDELCKYFKSALEGWSWGPLSIFLDSVDQLDDTNSGRNLAWLPLEGYNEQVHMVVSTLPDDLNPEVGSPICCLSTLMKGLSEENFVHVEALQDARELLCHLLCLKRRCATPDQMHAIVKALTFAEQNAKTPLMATLLAHLASGWNSFTKAPDVLPSSAREIIIEFFKILERKHGEILVRHVLCLITLSKQGLSVSELQEVLSLDDDALAAAFQWWVTPQLKMPSAPLVLLLTDLGPFLSRRGVLRSWYHRQLWEAVEAIYLKEPSARVSFHHMLAEFFNGRWSADNKPCGANLRIRLGRYDHSNEFSHCDQAGHRNVRDQPYCLKGASALHPGAQYNSRRCVEALYQMVNELVYRSQVEDCDQSTRVDWCHGMNICLATAVKELCSVDGVCARNMVGEGFNLVSQCASIVDLSSFEGSYSNASVINHYYKWIRRDTHIFKSQGQVVASLLRQPDMSEVRELYLSSKLSIPGIPDAVFGNSSDFDVVVTVLRGHTNYVQSLSWSPVGDRIASGSWDKTIIIWDAKTGDPISTLKGHSACVVSLAWSPGGDHIVSGCGDPVFHEGLNEIIIWDAMTGNKIFTLWRHSAPVMSVSWSPGGDHIVSGCGDPVFGNSENEIIIWDAETGDHVSTLRGHSAAVMSVSWSPGGDRIASGSYDKSIIIWDVIFGVQLSTLKGHSNWVKSVAWSPTGDRIASGSEDKTVIIWDTKTCDQISTLEGHTKEVLSVAWSYGGDRIASGSADKTIIIWDARTKSCNQISTLNGHSSWARCVTWNPGGDQIASGSYDKTIIVWDVKSGDKILTRKGHDSYVNCVAWSPMGDRITSGSADKSIIIWDAKTGDQVLTLRNHTSYVNSVVWSPSGDRLASGSSDDTIIIWDAKTGEQISAVKGHSVSVYSVAWSPRGDQIASGSYDNTISIWDVNTGDKASSLTCSVKSVACSSGGGRIASGGFRAGYAKNPEDNSGEILMCDGKVADSTDVTKMRFYRHKKGVQSVSWSPEGDRIICGTTDNTIIMWDAKTGDQVSTLKGHTDYVRSVAWSPDGDSLTSGSSDKTIVIWDAKTGEHISTLKGHTGSVYSVAWSPGGARIASGSDDETIIIWNAKTGDQVSTLKGHTSYVFSVAWSPVGDQIASGSGDKTIIIWNVEIDDHVLPDLLNTVAWSPVGDQIVSGSSNTSIIIWNAKTGEKVSTLKGHTDSIRHVAWSPNADQIISGSNDRTTIIWDVKTGKKVSTLKGHSDKVTCVVWSPRGDVIASGSVDMTIIIWDVKAGNHRSTFKGHTGGVNSVAWSPSGQHVASVSDDKTVIVWDANTGALVSQLKGHSDTVLSVAWSASGNQIISGSGDKTVIVWNAAAGEQRLKLEGHTSGITSVSCSPRGQVASGSKDKTVVIWNGQSGERITTLIGHPGCVHGVAWSPSGDKIVTVCSDEILFVWDGESGKKISTLQGIVGGVTSVARSVPATQVICDLQDVKAGEVSRSPGDNFVHCVAGQDNQATMISEEVTISSGYESGTTKQRTVATSESGGAATSGPTSPVRVSAATMKIKSDLVLLRAARVVEGGSMCCCNQ